MNGQRIATFISRFGDFIANYTNFDAKGHQTMVGDARPWRDELNDAISLKSTGPGVSVNITESAIEFTKQADLNDYLHCNVQLNHDRDLTVAIHPHIHWWQTSALIPNWLIQYRWQVNGGIKEVNWLPLKHSEHAHAYTPGTTLNQISEFGPINVPPGTALSDVVQFRVLRDCANTTNLFGTPGTDPVDATVSITNFDVHIQTNSLGSAQEYAK